MEYRVVWTIPARNDLRAVAEYIARDSRNYASQFVMRVQEQTKRLSLFPDQGRIIPEFGDATYRELIIGHYRLFYTIRDHDVFILAIVHGAKDFGPR